MPTINHKITHYYQPTSHSCSQTAMAILLSFFGKLTTPEQMMTQIPVNLDESGKELGTINQHLAVWTLSQGFKVEMYSADFQLLNLSWANLSKTKLLEKIKTAKVNHVVASLGKKWSRAYLQSYIDFIEAGGKLHIHSYTTTKLLDKLLVTSPLLACVCYNVLYNRSRLDTNNKPINHTIVIYGKDKAGNYLIADPIKQPGLHIIEPERLLAAMCAAQIECDNLFFQLKAGK